MLGIAAGNMRAPDVRGMIKQDIELLELIPVDQVERRAELQRVIDIRIDDLIAGVDKSQSLREMALSYRGNWRDIVVFLCAVLFTIVWWNISHSRSNWLMMFIVMILASIAAGLYASRGIVRALRSLGRHRDEDRDGQ